MVCSYFATIFTCASFISHVICSFPNEIHNSVEDVIHCKMVFLLVSLESSLLSVSTLPTLFFETSFLFLSLALFLFLPFSLPLPSPSLFWFLRKFLFTVWMCLRLRWCRKMPIQVMSINAALCSRHRSELFLASVEIRSLPHTRQVFTENEGEMVKLSTSKRSPLSLISLNIPPIKVSAIYERG